MFLTGYMAEKLFGYVPPQKHSDYDAGMTSSNFEALTNSIGMMSIIPWSICACFYAGLHWTFKSDKERAKMLSSDCNEHELQLEMEKTDHSDTSEAEIIGKRHLTKSDLLDEV